MILQEIDWARKQDLLSEVAFQMVSEGQESISEADFIARIESIQDRQGDTLQGRLVLEELVGSGVLCREGESLSFFRTSFREFFAAHHLHQRGELDSFAVENLYDRRWGGVTVLAAGLRRSNSKLLNLVSASVSRRRAQAVDGIHADDYFYAAYVCGRMLANSESADHEPKVSALRTTLEAVSDSVPDMTKEAVDQFGNFGHVMALIAAEHSLFVTIGVPWLRLQLKALLDDTSISDEQRYFVASAYVNLGYPDCYSVLERAIPETSKAKVLLALQVLIHHHSKVRRVEGSERVNFDSLQALLSKKLARRRDEIRSLMELKSEALKFERERMRRLHNREKRARKDN